MMAQAAGSTVLLSDSRDAPWLARQLAAPGGPVACYANLEELLRAQPMSSIDVLVVWFRPLPRGVLLAMLGRMTVDYPGMQKVAVLEGPLPLPVVEYLTGCGIDLVCTASREETLDRLRSVVHRMRERRGWIAPWTLSHRPAPRNEKERNHGRAS